MKLDLLGKDCDGGSPSGGCPTIYATDRGTYVVQGFSIDSAELPDLDLPVGEQVVEVPASLLTAIKDKL